MIKPYQRTVQALTDLLVSTQPGDALPSEPRLAAQLGVSRATLREAMSALEDRGLIVRRQGVGTYVARTVIDAGLEELVSIERLAAQVGLKVEMGECEIVARMPEIDELELGSPLGVVDISRVIRTEGKPVAYLVDTISDSLIPRDELVKDFGGSVLDLLLACGELELEYSRTDINAVSAEPDISARLGVSVGTVLLYLEARLFAREGQVVDRSRSYFVPGWFEFHVVRRIGRGLKA